MAPHPRVTPILDEAFLERVATADTDELRSMVARQRMWFWVGLGRTLLLAFVVAVALVGLVEGKTSWFGWIFGVGGPVVLGALTRSLVRTRNQLAVLRASLPT